MGDDHDVFDSIGGVQLANVVADVGPEPRLRRRAAAALKDQVHRRRQRPVLLKLQAVSSANRHASRN